MYLPLSGLASYCIILHIHVPSSSDEIREDLEDVVTRLKPWVTPEGDTQFAGWARMALHIGSFSVVEVGQPRVGENRIPPP